MSRFLLMVMVAGCGSSGGKTFNDAAADAVPTGTALTHVVYLNFEGQAISPGGDDATVNTSMLATAPATLRPAFPSGSARQTQIDSLVAEIEAPLAPYGIYVVTTRPATGPYDMVVFTDDSGSVLNSSAAAALALSAGLCNAKPSPVNFVFQTGTQSRHQASRSTIAMIGVSAGVPLSKVSTDCMCLADAACGTPAAPCTIGGPGTAAGSNAVCTFNVGATNDESMFFLNIFGTR